MPAILREFLKTDVPVEAGPVGALEFANQLQALPLLLAPLCGLAVEDVGVDATVEPIDGHGIDAVPLADHIRPKPPDRVLVVLLPVAVASAWRPLKYQNCVHSRHAFACRVRNIVDF